jgi:F1F0 ATPase subunit 2
MLIAIGIIVGAITGLINFFIFEKQMKIFFNAKKWYLLVSGYIIRYALIVAVFYLLAKKNKTLFFSAIAGFFIYQIVFFSRKAKELKSH